MTITIVNRSFAAAFAALIGLTGILHAEDAATLSLRKEVEFLASEDLAGRMTGSEGARRAADFLAEELKKAGYEPGGDGGTYFQEFEFSAGVEIDPAACSLTLTPADGESREVALDSGFRPFAFTSNGSAEGEVVFAGYGLRAPGEQAQGYDSYAGLDVKDKIVLVFRYAPENVAADRKAELNRYAGLRYKAMLAREQGARAILVVTGPNSPGAGDLVSLTTDAGNSGSGIPAASIDLETAQAILAAAGKDLHTVQTALDQEDPHAESAFAIPNLIAKLETTVDRRHRPCNNVIGVLPPTGGAEEFVMLGAHYDHLGHGEAGAMNRKGEEHAIHYGADDNASGTVAVLEIARALAADRDAGSSERGVVIAFWSGEELGLLGSSHAAEHPPVPLDRIAAYVNFDMVGRLRDDTLSLQGIGSSPDWTKHIEKRNVAAGFRLSLHEDPYLPTDSTPFYSKEIPILNFFTGAHEDYHRPTDTADKLNYAGMRRIAAFAAGLTKDLAVASQPPAWVKVERSTGGGSRDAMRIYIGSIPDYVTEVAGVKLSGVRGDSPADKGGLKGGDIIVGFNGQKITNIYDYTYALDSAKVGEPLEIVVLRDGSEATLTVKPEARK